MRLIGENNFSVEWLRSWQLHIAGATIASSILLFSATYSSIAQQTSDLHTPSELVELLADGGLILFVRHAATDHSQSDQDISDLSRCDLQRNLSQQGKDEAATIRAAVEKHQIPIGAILTSPYCRTVDTARLAFGRYTIVHDLRATFFTSASETNEINRKLRVLLSEAPDSGTNTVLVGHTANLSDVTDVWPKPEGVTHIFRPLGLQGFEHLGRITPEDWEKLLSIENN